MATSSSAAALGGRIGPSPQLQQSPPALSGAPAPQDIHQNCNNLLKRAKRRTKALYDKYIALKKEKQTQDDKCKGTLKENEEIKRANRLLSEQVETLTKRNRETLDKVAELESYRKKYRGLKKNLAEMELFKERREEKLRNLEEENQRISAEMERMEDRLEKFILERDSLMKKADLLERNNKELAARAKRATAQQHRANEKKLHTNVNEPHTPPSTLDILTSEQHRTVIPWSGSNNYISLIVSVLS